MRRLVKRPKEELSHPLPTFIRPLRDAVRQGIKTCTRRVAKRQPTRFNPNPPLPNMMEETWPPERDGRGCPYGATAIMGVTKFYLREPLRKAFKATTKNGKVRHMAIATYADDDKPVLVDGKPLRWKWKRRVLAQRCMPRIAARTFTVLMERRGEWLNEIDEDDAEAEGALVGFEEHPEPPSALAAFSRLWDTINANPKSKRKTYPFAINPFCYVLRWKPVI